MSFRVCFAAALLMCVLSACRGLSPQKDSPAAEPEPLRVPDVEVAAGHAWVDVIAGDRQVITLPLKVYRKTVGSFPETSHMTVNGVVLTAVRGSADSPIRLTQSLPASVLPPAAERQFYSPLEVSFVIDPPIRDRLEHVEGFVSFTQDSYVAKDVPVTKPALGQELTEGLWLEGVSLTRHDGGPVTEVTVTVKRTTGELPQRLFDKPRVYALELVKADGQSAPALGRMGWARAESATGEVFRAVGTFKAHGEIAQVRVYISVTQREARVPFTLTDVPLTH